jgi:hypothetical protein
VPRDHAEGDDQDGLWQELRSIIGSSDPVPATVLQAARDSFTWRTVDAELAALAFDSLIDQPRIGAVRGPAASRLLTFDSPNLTIEVEVTVVGAGRQLVGQLVPHQQTLVTIRHRGGTIAVQTDALGRFMAEGLQPGPSSLHCQVGGAAVVVTDWVAL